MGTAGSDVDIVIFENGKTDCATRVSALLNEVLPLPYFFDVVSYAQVQNPEFIDHINRVGQVLFTREHPPTPQ